MSTCNTMLIGVVSKVRQEEEQISNPENFQARVHDLSVFKSSTQFGLVSILTKIQCCLCV